ncbi:hypothetical protein [Paenibacillus taichungensis]
MLTLIRGKARKSIYMEALYKSSNNAVYVLYGTDHYPVTFSPNHDVRTFPRLEASKENLSVFEKEIRNIVEQTIESKYKTVFIYANLNKAEEIETLKSINDEVDGRIHLVVSVQDKNIPDGQIIIEEIL